MTLIDKAETFNFDEVAIDELWNFPIEKELKIHQIHAYPAKFPGFVTTKAIEYAKNKNIDINTIADVEQPPSKQGVIISIIGDAILIQLQRLLPKQKAEIIN